MSEYDIHLLSSGGAYPEFRGIEHDWFMNDEIEYERGTVLLGGCAGTEYDTQISRDNSPIAAISSEEPFYFLKTLVALEYIRGNYEF